MNYDQTKKECEVNGKWKRDFGDHFCNTRDNFYKFVCFHNPKWA